MSRQNMTSNGVRNNQISSTNLKLDPDAVRRRASAIAGCIEVMVPNNSSAFNKKKSPTKPFGNKLSSPTKNNQLVNPAITFLVGVVSTGSSMRTVGSAASKAASSTNSGSVDELARITIYCDTGTIATGRVFNGAIRHTFRRNVTSLDVVERCLKYPAKLTKIDWQLVSMTDTAGSGAAKSAMTCLDNNDKRITSPKSSTSSTREHSIKSNLELCDVGLAMLQSELEKLVEHASSIDTSLTATAMSTSSAADVASLSSLAVQVPAQSSSPALGNINHSSNDKAIAPGNSKSQNQAAQVVSPSYANGVAGPAPTSGMEFQFSLAERPMKHVDQCLTDIQKMNKIVHAVSTNGVGTVFLYGNGGVAYTPNIPRTLYQKLSQLRYSKVHSSRPQYVSLGSRERYFVAFHDGTVSYKGPKGLDKELRKLTPPPQSSATNASTGSSSVTQNILSKQMSSASSFISAKFSEQQQPQNSKQLWPLRSVAFGSSYDTFCIVFQDGSYKYQGKSFPKDLEETLLKLSARREHEKNGDRIRDLYTDDDVHDALHAESSRQNQQQQSSRNVASTASARRKSTESDDDDGDDYPLQHYYNKKKADERERKQNQKMAHTVSTVSSTSSTTSFTSTKHGSSTSGVGAMCITLGPSGEWFLRTEDGHMEWGGISEEMDEAIQQLLDDDHRLNYFDFGEDLSYFVSYD